MEERPSKLWNIVLVFSLLFLAAVSYVKIEPFRELVDGKCPWVKEQLASRGITFQGSTISITSPAPATAVSSASTPAASNPVQEQQTDVARQPSAASSPSTVAKPAKQRKGPLDINRVVADRSLWPSSVHLKKTTLFPAVLDGKKVGELNVPAGTEVKVVQVSPGKVAVAYTPNGNMANAGGAWLTMEETDFTDRVLAAHPDL